MLEILKEKEKRRNPGRSKIEGLEILVLVEAMDFDLGKDKMSLEEDAFKKENRGIRSERSICIIFSNVAKRKKSHGRG